MVRAAAFAFFACTLGCGDERGDSGPPIIRVNPAPDDANPPGDAGTPGDAGVSPGGCEAAAPEQAPGVWVEVWAPAGQTGFRVTDAFSPAPHEIYFAGVIPGPDGTSVGRVLRWSHGCWRVELDLDGRLIRRASIHGTGPNDLWAVGGDAIHHRDAQGWSRFDDGWRTLVTVQPFFEPGLQRVRAAAPGDVWIAERGNILHWNENDWTVFNFDDPTYPNESASVGFNFADLWIDGVDDVWVAGGSDQVGSTMDPAFVHHFAAGTWSRVYAQRYGVAAIWRAGAALWLAVPGTMALADGVNRQVTLQRHDGVNPPAAVPVDGSPLEDHMTLVSLWGRGADDLWAGGDDVAHFDGTTWSVVPDAPEAARSTHDMNNTHVAGDRHSVWLSTPGPRFFRKVDRP